MLEVTDLGTTIEFYTSKLGFTVTGTFPEATPTWCSLQRDGVILMFNQMHTHEPSDDHDHDHPDHPTLTGSLYFYPDDADALFAEFKAAGVTSVEWEPTSMDYGMRDFAIVDPDGYVLVFGSPL